MLETVKGRDYAVCNCCGRSERLDRLEGPIVECDYVEIRVKWGYFSSKDLEMHRSHLCEPCYDRIWEAFAIPSEIREYIIGTGLDPFADPPLDEDP